MIRELPNRFQILAYKTNYYNVNVEEGTLESAGRIFEGYTESQMLEYINVGVWEITKVYEDRPSVVKVSVEDLL